MGKKSKNGKKKKSKSKAAAAAAANNQVKTKEPTIPLTEGAIEPIAAINDRSEEQPNFKTFTVQVIDAIPEDEDCCRFVLSDGTHFMEVGYIMEQAEAAATEAIKRHLRRRKIKKNCLINVIGFYINRDPDFDGSLDESIMLVDFEVVGHMNGKIGNPTRIELTPLIDPLGVQRLVSLKSSKDDPGFQPVFQVINISSVETAHSTQYHMDLSDGKIFVSAISASSQVDDLIKKGDIRLFSVIRICEFANNLIDGSIFLLKVRQIVDDINLLDDQKIGSPVGIYKHKDGEPVGESSQGKPQKVKSTTVDYCIEPITAYAVRRLFFLKMSRDEPNFKPVVQVVSMAKTNESSIYRLEVSDGRHFVRARCGAQLHGLIKKGDITINSLIRIESFTTVVDELNLDGTGIIMLWTIKKVGQFHHNKSGDHIDIEEAIKEEEKRLDNIVRKRAETQLRTVELLDQAITEVQGESKKDFKVGDIVCTPSRGNDCYNWGKIASSKVVPTQGMRYYIQFHEGGESRNVPADEIFRGICFFELIRTGLWHESLPPKDYLDELSQLVEKNDTMKCVSFDKPLPTNLTAASVANTNITTTTENRDEFISFKIRYQGELETILKKKKGKNTNDRSKEDEYVSFLTESIKTETSGISFKLLIYPYGNCEYRQNNGWVSFYLLCMDSLPYKQVTTTGLIRLYPCCADGVRGQSANNTRDISFHHTFKYVGDYGSQSRLITSEDMMSKYIDQDGNWTVEIHFNRIIVTQMRIAEMPPAKARSSNNKNKDLKPSVGKHIFKSSKVPRESTETAEENVEPKMKPQGGESEKSKLESAAFSANTIQIQNTGRKRSSLFKKLLPLANRKQRSLKETAKTDIKMKSGLVLPPSHDKEIHRRSPQTITTSSNDGQKKALKTFVDDMLTRLKEAKAKVEEEKQQLQQNFVKSHSQLPANSAYDKAQEEQQENRAQLLYMNLDGKSATLDHVDLLGTIEQVRIKIYDKERVPLHLQSLNFGGKQLEDGHSLAYYKVYKGSTLHLKLRRGASWKIYIKPLSGKIITLDAQPDHTVDIIRSKIYDKEGVPPNQQRLFFGGKELEDDKTLSYYKIQNRYTVLFAMRVAQGHGVQCINTGTVGLALKSTRRPIKS